MIKEKISKFIATGFYSGFSPLIPGTVGSAAYVALWFLLQKVFFIPALTINIFGFLFSAIVGTIACHITLKNGTQKDPRYIVIDEWAGMAVPLFIIDIHNYILIGIAFVVFRILDVLKPSPARELEGLPGAYGVMADDVAAGIYTLIVCYIAKAYFL